MDWFTAEGYWWGRLLFQRALAVIYLVAFLNAVNQFRPLLGANGMSPIPRFVQAVPFRRAPSVFHLHYSDRFFAILGWTGAALAAAAAGGLVDRLPLAGHMAVWAVLWLLYLSIVNVGQTWYGFGWESLLLEAGFLAIFLGGPATAPPLPVLVLLRWLLFRVEFGAGLIKLRGDRCWRDLTCLYYHHETQPMPGPFSRHFHRLPRRLHRVEVLANHVAQLVVPFGLFAPQPVAAVAAVVMIVTQLWLIASGNFSWLNWITVVLALSVLPDAYLTAIPAVTAAAGTGGPPPVFAGIVLAVSVLVVGLSYRPLANLLGRGQLMNASFDRLRLVNTYGAFGSITRTRYEIVVEGTAEGVLTESTTWREYEFKGKPGDVHRLPPQVAPYHLRLDWQMWFAALSPGHRPAWFAAFVRRLLRNDAPTLELLRHNPFPDEPPAYVRARLYRYRFATGDEHRATGARWTRSLVGEYLPPVPRG